MHETRSDPKVMRSRINGTVMQILVKIVFIALMFVPGASRAQNNSQVWRWHYSSFEAPWSKNDILIRAGTAQVVLENGKVSIKLHELDFPELHATFTGSLSKNGEVRGSLDGFILDGGYSEMLIGDYQEQNIVLKGNKDNCHMQEIVLRPNYVSMNGAVFVLVQFQGMCEEKVLMGPSGPVDD